MAEPLVNGLDPRKKLYSALVGSSDKELASEVKKFSYNKFNTLLDNNDFVQDLFMDISERGIILDPKNPGASKDPVEFANAFIYKAPPAPKQQAAPTEEGGDYPKLNAFNQYGQRELFLKEIQKTPQDQIKEAEEKNWALYPYANDDIGKQIEEWGVEEVLKNIPLKEKDPRRQKKQTPSAPAKEQEAYIPPPQPAVGSPEYDKQLQRQYGGMSPTLGATFAGAPASFETEEQKKQEQISPVFKAQKLAFEDVPIAEEQRESQRQFAKATKEQQKAALRGGTGFELQQEKANEAREATQKLKDFGSSLGATFDNMIDKVKAAERIFAAKQRALLTFGDRGKKAEQEEKKVKQDIYNYVNQLDQEFAAKQADYNIEGNLFDVISKGQLDKLPEAFAYNIAQIGINALGAGATGGYSTFAQVFPDMYKSGVEEIARKTKTTPEQVIASGKDEEVISYIGGVASGYIDYLSSGFLGQAMKSQGAYKFLRDKALEKIGKTRWKQAAASAIALGGTAGIEGGTEGLQGLTEVIAPQIAAADTFKEARENIYGELQKPSTQRRLASDIVGGFAGGGALAAGGRAINRALEGDFTYGDVRKVNQRADYDVVQLDNKIQERNKIVKAMEEAVKANPEAEGQIRQQYQKRVNEAAPADDEVLMAYESLALLPETEEKNSIRENLEAYMAEKGLQPAPSEGLGEGMRMTAPQVEPVNPPPPSPIAPEAPAAPVATPVSREEMDANIEAGQKRSGFVFQSPLASLSQEAKSIISNVQRNKYIATAPVKQLFDELYNAYKIYANQRQATSRNLTTSQIEEGIADFENALEVLGEYISKRDSGKFVREYVDRASQEIVPTEEAAPVTEESTMAPLTEEPITQETPVEELPEDEDLASLVQDIDSIEQDPAEEEVVTEEEAAPEAPVLQFESPQITIDKPLGFAPSLRKLGYTDEEISKMTIEQQQQIVINKIEPARAESTSKVDVVKENQRVEKVAEAQRKIDEEIAAEEAAQAEGVAPAATTPKGKIEVVFPTAFEATEVRPYLKPEDNYYRPDQQLKFNQGTYEPVRIIAHPDVIRAMSIGSKLRDANKRKTVTEQEINFADGIAKQLGFTTESGKGNAIMLHNAARELAKQNRSNTEERFVVIGEEQGGKKKATPVKPSPAAAETKFKPNPNATYYISKGADEVFYTLREIAGDDLDVHVMNLSKDLADSKQKAKELIGEDVEFDETSLGRDYNKIKANKTGKGKQLAQRKEGEGVAGTLSFGKYNGKTIDEIFEIDKPYILYLNKEYPTNTVFQKGVRGNPKIKEFIEQSLADKEQQRKNLENLTEIGGVKFDDKGVAKTIPIKGKIKYINNRMGPQGMYKVYILDTEYGIPVEVSGDIAKFADGNLEQGSELSFTANVQKSGDKFKVIGRKSEYAKAKAEQAAKPEPKKEESPKQETQKPEPKKEEPKKEQPSSTTPQEGDTVEIAPQREGGSPRKMVFKGGEWKQNVGGEVTIVGASVQQQAQEAFAGKAEVKPATETASTSNLAAQVEEMRSLPPAKRKAAQQALEEEYGKEEVAKMIEITANFTKIIEDLEQKQEVKKDCP